MKDKIINLKEILLIKITADCYWEELESLTNCPIEFVIEAMKEACRQTLELAAEKADLDIFDVDSIEIDKQSILNTIHQIK